MFNKMNNFYSQLKFDILRISKYSCLEILFKSTNKIFFLSFGILLLPISMVLHFYGFRVLDIFINRIGHLALETDCVIKETILKGKSTKKFILLAPKNTAANQHILEYISDYLIIIDNLFLCDILKNMSYFWFLKFSTKKYVRQFKEAQKAYRIYSDWDLNEPIFKLKLSDELWAEHMLSKLGIPQNSWFVCIHVREPGYSMIDDDIQYYRNSSIDNLYLAVEEITKRGGWVLRMGNPGSTDFFKMSSVIDYANHELRSDRLDLILCAKARFFLGNTSGIAILSTIFGVPCAIANCIPISTLWFTSKDICIHKFIYEKRNNIILTYKHILSSELANYKYTQNYLLNDLIVIENSNEDINNLVLDMFDLLDKNYNEILSKKVKEIYKNEHLSFQSISKISERFLSSHPELF